MSHQAKKKGKGYQPKVAISGPGVMHIRSSEIVKTDEAKRQIEALRKYRNKLIPKHIKA